MTWEGSSSGSGAIINVRHANARERKWYQLGNSLCECGFNCHPSTKHTLAYGSPTYSYTHIIHIFMRERVWMANGSSVHLKIVLRTRIQRNKNITQTGEVDGGGGWWWLVETNTKNTLLEKPPDRTLTTLHHELLIFMHTPERVSMYALITHFINIIEPVSMCIYMSMLFSCAFHWEYAKILYTFFRACMYAYMFADKCQICSHRLALWMSPAMPFIFFLLLLFVALFVVCVLNKFNVILIAIYWCAYCALCASHSGHKEASIDIIIMWQAFAGAAGKCA